MKKLTVALLAVTVAASLSFAAPARRGLFLDQSVQASYDPLGLQFVTRLSYQVPLSHSTKLLWESTKIEFGIQDNLSPGFEMIGPFLTIEPVAFFSLTLTAQAAGFFNVFGFGFYDLAGYGDGFNANSLSSLTSKNTSGYVLSAAPTLKFAVGPLVAFDTASLTCFDVDNGKGFFFERTGNVALAKRDIEFGNQAYVLAKVLPGLLVGASDVLLIVPASGDVSQRLNCAGIYAVDLNDRLSWYGALMIGTFLRDRYYVGTLYVAGGLGFRWRIQG